MSTIYEESLKKGYLGPPFTDAELEAQDAQASSADEPVSEPEHQPEVVNEPESEPEPVHESPEPASSADEHTEPTS